ncbi:MAG TPA: peroxiredoxin, partial [Propionibacteriaceae bacterium]|nr:peroxiredoxin [Propionibacteriaceae bacterium]
MTTLRAGDQAPAFTLPNAENEPVSLSDFAGGRVIV